MTEMMSGAENLDDLVAVGEAAARLNLGDITSYR